MRKALYLLGILEDQDVEWIVRHGKKLRVPAGTQLMQEGTPSEWLYFVLDGAFVVSTTTAARVAVLKAGEVIGEVSFVDDRPPTASVHAEQGGLVGAVPRVALARKLAEDVGFAARFYKSIATFLADRLRTTTGSLGVQRFNLDPETEDLDELAPHLLRDLAMAGARFAEMQRRDWGLD